MIDYPILTIYYHQVSKVLTPDTTGLAMNKKQLFVADNASQNFLHMVVKPSIY